jgi:hypothetical protein
MMEEKDSTLGAVRLLSIPQISLSDMRGILALPKATRYNTGGFFALSPEGKGEPCYSPIDIAVAVLTELTHPTDLITDLSWWFNNRIPYGMSQVYLNILHNDRIITNNLSALAIEYLPVLKRNAPFTFRNK